MLSSICMLNTYSGALIQPVHQKDEFRAFCVMVDHHLTLPGPRDVFIGDRGYCSYNNMAHVIEKGRYFRKRFYTYLIKKVHGEKPTEAIAFL